MFFFRVTLFCQSSFSSRHWYRGKEIDFDLNMSSNDKHCYEDKPMSCLENVEQENQRNINSIEYHEDESMFDE